MGGAVPFGYDVRDKALVVNPSEAGAVRTIFAEYLAAGTVREVRMRLEELVVVSKRRTDRHCRVTELLERKTNTIRQIEDREGLRSGSVSRVLPLAWLAPDISTAILKGRQPRHLTAKKLRSLPELPLDWHDQRKILSFPHQ